MNILLGVSASIAIYKSCDLTRLLTKKKHAVQVVMTKNAASWISPVLFSALSGKKAYCANEENDFSMAHIDIRNNIDLFLIAPATADVIARAAAGRADELLTALLLSYSGKKAIAPAMNPNMYKSPPVQKNLKTLKEFGYSILEPSKGESVCGESGEGKMMPIEEIVSAIEKL
ncbi:MAG: phosphopantothenoylcysteine decarboxylase [Spirochaetia bacterium]|nr:phosphopantothenoylcysteine decarboxylase [Spirochaetia bacterium]